MKEKTSKPVSMGRHRAKCSVCKHPDCAQIEADFVDWGSPNKIVETHKLTDRFTLFRHAHACALFERRNRNIRRAAERIVERVDECDVTAAAVVAAIQALAKINANGQWIDRTETVNLKDLFDKMSAQELDAYAKDGTLPRWFPQQQAYSRSVDSGRNSEEQSA